MKKLFKNFSIKNLKLNINKYGYKYSTKDFIFETSIIILIIFVIAYISKLHIEYILSIILLTIFIIPILINALFKQNYNIKRFSLLTDYLNNIIPIFSQKTKIRYSLGELFDITSGEMKDSIFKAIKHLDNTKNDPNILKNSLAIIEDEFPNSRVKSVHKLLLNIEAQNSLDYKDVCDNMYEDIDAWIKRIFKFQKELKNRRNKILILCMMTLILNCLFVFIYTSNNIFIGFTDGLVYQVSTSIFIASILITITIVLTRLNGEWLINDLNYKKDDELKKYYDKYKEGKKRIKLPEILFIVLCFGASIYLFILKEYVLMALALFISFLVYIRPFITYKKTYKKVLKTLTVEFPIWLREVSLNLNNLTVLNAISLSQNSVSYPMRKEIRKFLEEVKKDPVSIKPYNNFLNDFDLEDARSSMKVLYSLQNISKSNIKKRVSNLILRNQEMLDKAETIKNNDSISGIETIAYIPTVLFSFQMIVSMFSMLAYIMASLSGSLNL